MAARTEYKYLVPNALLDRIRSDIAPYVAADSFSKQRGTKGYTVRSVYYDTPQFDCYDEKLDGLTARRKYRIRGYDRPHEKSLVFLEIKRKYVDRIAKSRAPLLYRDLDAFFLSSDIHRYILALTGTGEETIDARRFLYHYYRQGLRPAVLVVYDREPFFGKFDPSLRVSIDRDLRGSIFPSLNMLFDDQCLEYAMSHHFILELKFFRGALPAWVQSLITRYELPRMALSKFTICLDSQKALRRHSQMRSRVFSPVRNQA